MKIAIKKLKIFLDMMILQNPDFLKEQEANKLSVLDKYRPMFSAKNIQNLSASEFQGFLNFEINLHWKGLQRQGPNLCKNMSRLRDTIVLLTYNSLPLKDRITQAEKVPHLGKAILSSILQVIFPVECGIWNEISEKAMKDLGIFSERKNKDFGDYYLEINKILLTISKELKIDLWTLDTLLFYWNEIKDYWPKIEEALK